MTSSVITSQSVILTTAMAVSGAVILLSLNRIRNLPTTHQNSSSNSQTHLPPSCLRSCLSSDDKKKKKKKKRVKFADNVKDHKSELTKMINGKKEKKVEIFNDDKKIPEFRRMPANRAALYQGILRDRVHRINVAY